MEVLLFTKYTENNALGMSLGKKARFNFLVQTTSTTKPNNQLFAQTNQFEHPLKS